jgi:anti-anti-sigma factor
MARVRRAVPNHCHSFDGGGVALSGGGSHPDAAVPSVASPLYQIHIDRAHSTVRLSGEFDMAAGPRLDEIGRLISGCSSLIVEMADVRFIDVEGLRHVLAIGDHLGPGARFVLRSPSRPVRRLLAFGFADRVPDLIVDEVARV